MNKTNMMVLAVLVIGLLAIAGCASASTSGAPRAPVIPSGGGCGVGAPAEGAAITGEIADRIDSGSAL